MIEAEEHEEWPRGVIVGSAVIERVEEVSSCQTSASPVESLLVASGKADAGHLLTTNNQKLATSSPLYAWHLKDVQRVKKLRKPKGHPQPVWFTPF